MGSMVDVLTREHALHTRRIVVSGGQSHILQIEANSVNMENNINWAMSCDCGGEGPTADDEAHVEHFVYLLFTK